MQKIARSQELDRFRLPELPDVIAYATWTYACGHSVEVREDDLQALISISLVVGDDCCEESESDSPLFGEFRGQHLATIASVKPEVTTTKQPEEYMGARTCAGGTVGSAVSLQDQDIEF